MMTEILKNFRTLAPEFVQTSDNEIFARIEFYKDFCSKKRFGKFYSRAVALLTAHFLVLDKISDSAADGATNAALTSGTIKREKEGDLEIEYNSSSSSSSAADEIFEKTIYGKMFLQIRRFCIVPVTIRKGFDFCGCPHF